MYHNSHAELTFKYFNRMTTLTTNHMNDNIEKVFDPSDLDRIIRIFSEEPRERCLENKKDILKLKINSLLKMDLRQLPSNHHRY